MVKTVATIDSPRYGVRCVVKEDERGTYCVHVRRLSLSGVISGSNVECKSFLQLRAALMHACTVAGVD